MVQKGMKFGAISGGVGLVLNILVSAVLGICGPFVALLAGTVAGFLAVRSNQVASQKEGASLGATSGAIAGALVLAGQIIGSIIALFLVLSLDVEVAFGTLPQNSAEQIGYWAGGLGVGACFGLVGIVLGAGGGALAGYLTSSNQPPDSAPQQQSSEPPLPPMG